jgi:hypothetical protein
MFQYQLYLFIAQFFPLYPGISLIPFRTVFPRRQTDSFQNRLTRTWRRTPHLWRLKAEFPKGLRLKSAPSIFDMAPHEAKINYCLPGAGVRPFLSRRVNLVFSKIEVRK